LRFKRASTQLWRKGNTGYGRRKHHPARKKYGGPLNKKRGSFFLRKETGKKKKEGENVSVRISKNLTRRHPTAVE